MKEQDVPLDGGRNGQYFTREGGAGCIRRMMLGIVRTQISKIIKKKAYMPRCISETSWRCGMPDFYVEGDF